MQVFKKQTGELLDFDFDFADWLAARGSDTITEASIVADAGLTIASSVIVNNVLVKFFCSGGTSGQRYKVTCIIQTTGGRVKESECVIDVRDV